MDSKRTALAGYILCLSESLAQTHHAGDRPLYQMYLADAAVLLALLMGGAESSRIHARIVEHERLWAQTFLVGPEHVAAREAWQRFKSTN